MLGDELVVRDVNEQLLLHEHLEVIRDVHLQVLVSTQEEINISKADGKLTFLKICEVAPLTIRMAFCSSYMLSSVLLSLHLCM